jgi:hypothetical protein
MAYIIQNPKRTPAKRKPEPPTPPEGGDWEYKFFIFSLCVLVGTALVLIKC